jgi:hypothetical protein
MKDWAIHQLSTLGVPRRCSLFVRSRQCGGELG